MSAQAKPWFFLYGQEECLGNMSPSVQHVWIYRIALQTGSVIFSLNIYLLGEKHQDIFILEQNEKNKGGHCAAEHKVFSCIHHFMLIILQKCSSCCKEPVTYICKLLFWQKSLVYNIAYNMLSVDGISHHLSAVCRVLKCSTEMGSVSTNLI